MSYWGYYVLPCEITSDTLKVGNSINDDPPETFSTSALFAESEKIVGVAFVVVHHK